MHHEQRYERMRDLVHPDFDLPSELRGYQLLDAAGLSDDQLEKILANLPADRPPKYREVRAKLKQLFGREAKLRSGARGPDHALVTDALEEPSARPTGGTPAAGEQWQGWEGDITWHDDEGNEYWLGPDEEGVQTIYVASKGGGKRGRKNWKPLARKGSGKGKGAGAAVAERYPKAKTKGKKW